MDIEIVREYCLNKKGVTESFPFGPDTLVFKVGTKVFLLSGLDRFPFNFNVKTKPEWSEDLRAKYAQIYGAFHMNKKHWNTVECEGIKPELIYKLIDQSYDLVLNSLTKKEKELILNS